MAALAAPQENEEARIPSLTQRVAELWGTPLGDEADDGPRVGTAVESLSSLKPAFKARPTQAIDGNTLPFPLPSDLSHYFTDQPRSWPEELRCLYKSLGTWEVPADAVQQALEARVAVPLRLKPPSGADSVGKDQGAASSAEADAEEWRCIVAVKEQERGSWGRFDDAPFLLPRPIWWKEDEAKAKAPCYRGPAPTDPLSFRAGMHEGDDDSSGLDTSLDPGKAAWKLVGANLLGVVPKEEWEASAAGGFCLRKATEPPAATGPVVVDEDWCCAVCLDEETTGLEELPCGHVFHERCVRRWWTKSNRCPLCRRRSGRRVLPPLNPDMDYVVRPWPVMPDGVVASDELLPKQLEVLRLRAERSPGVALQRRRLTKYFTEYSVKYSRSSRRGASRTVPELQPEFFQELLPSEEASPAPYLPRGEGRPVYVPPLVGPEVVAARFRIAREQAAEELEQRAAAGSEVTSFPTERCWPVLPMSARTAARRAAVTERWQARDARWASRRESQRLRRESWESRRSQCWSADHRRRRRTQGWWADYRRRWARKAADLPPDDGGDAGGESDAPASTGEEDNDHQIAGAAADPPSSSPGVGATSAPASEAVA